LAKAAQIENRGVFSNRIYDVILKGARSLGLPMSIASHEKGDRGWEKVKAKEFLAKAAKNEITAWLQPNTGKTKPLVPIRSQTG
jgi:hypothetical protein